METKTLELPVILPGYYEDCVNCLERLRNDLLALEGMKQVQVDVEASTVTLTYDSNYLSMEKIEQQARQIGVGLAETYSHETIRLAGLDCPDCALKIEKTVARMRGVLWASVNYASSSLSVEYETRQIDRQQIAGTVRRLGYDVQGRSSARSKTCCRFWSPAGMGKSQSDCHDDCGYSSCRWLHH
jgi:copper ion binding protein